MSTKLFVGSLPWSVDDDALKSTFSAHGSVVSAKVVKDRESGRSKGFGFVEMSTDSEAQTAMQALNGSEVNGRNIIVNEAKPKG
ncbi:MAG: RNA-binding protein [Ignavibacteria bacterium CG_4_8_14_3_um_filter_37_9]|nr:RNA-binding protein [Ignavibacteria bacterium]PIW99303.1 MAG: RNA-binding protein [Ignavibacteria bacterium CG_4_8_14_3_um_filter_37_9]